MSDVTIDPATCDEATLDTLSVSMKLPRRPNETTDDYRARVVAAWPTRPDDILGGGGRLGMGFASKGLGR